MYYHPSVGADGQVSAARQVSRGNITTTLSANLSGQLNAEADALFAIPSYVFATPFLGAKQRWACS